MSSFKNSTIYSFIAPISICQQHIATTGSWETIRTHTLEEMLVSPKTPLRIILHHWQQQHRDIISDVCLSWIEDNTNSQYIELHATLNPPQIQHIAPYIQSILESKHQEMFTLYQHRHPGAVRSLGTAMSVGNEGASQSD